MNNTDVSNRDGRKGCEMLDSPDYFHIQELLDILVFFVTGKMKFVVILINMSLDKVMRICHEDLSWLILSTIRLAQTYLKTDKSQRLCQRRSGIDDCEHEFARTKLRNLKPT